MRKKKKTSPVVPRQRLLTTVITTLVLLIMVLFLFGRVISLNFIDGGSMGPRYSGLAVTNRLAYTVREPQRGDVIAFEHSGAYLIKRIIGIPGDTIEFKGGCVLLNGKVYEEPYLAEGTVTEPVVEGYVYEVPEGMYFVMGDARQQSSDSRFFLDPYVDNYFIKGRVMAVVDVTRPAAFLVERYRFAE